MANLFSGITDFLSGGQMSDALDKLSKSSDQFKNLKAPDLASLIPDLKLQVMQGTMSPASASAAINSVVGRMDPATAKVFLQQASQMGLVQSDESSIRGQRTALGQLADIADNQGLTEADRAQFAAVMNQANANAAQQRAAQIQQLQMQGNAGTGAELAARLSGIQGAANSNAAAGADVAKAAQARALAAIQAGLQGNANLNTQMFDQAARKAQAQDAVNQFNANAQNTIGLNNAQMQQQANSQNFQTANQVAMANQAAQNAANIANAQNAQAANLANFGMANTIAGTNVGIQNQQLMMPYNAAQANFTNQLNKATAGSTADYRAGSVLADLAGKQLSNTVGGATSILNSPLGQQVLTGAGKAVGEIPWGSLAGAAGSALNSAGSSIGDAVGSAWDTVSSWFSDEDLKTDKQPLTDEDVDQMMASLTGYKYRYKSGNGTKNPVEAGTLAQDMEKGFGSVIDTPNGKMVQGPQAMSKALAVLANTHSRLRSLEDKAGK